jgi:hypothetical protein
VANAILTLGMITRQALRLWKNSNAFIQNVNRQYDDEYAVSGAKIGSTLKIRLPNDFVVSTGAALSAQDTAEQSTTLVVSTQKHVDVSFSSVDRTLSLDDYSERILAPMVNNLAGAVAADVMSGVEGGRLQLCRQHRDRRGGRLAQRHDHPVGRRGPDPELCALEPPEAGDRPAEHGAHGQRPVGPVQPVQDHLAPVRKRPDL